MTRSDRRLASGPHSGVVTSKLEREVKLAVDPDFRLPRLSGVPLPRRLLVSTYYDTVSHDLAHARITLRHRVERGKAAWQLKIPLDADRQEIEVIDRTPLPPAPLRGLLLLHLQHRRLVPVATLKVWRTGVRIRRNRVPVAEIALDQVSVVKNGLVIQRFRELEIEQLGSDDLVVRDVERLLREAGAREHDGRPKLFRALSLSASVSDAPPERDSPLIDHLKWALAQHVRWLLAHDPGTRLGTEREALHQMRVDTRRLRAVLRAAGPVLVPEWAESLENELSWLSGFLGQARDLDVQIAYFTAEAARLDARDRKPVTQFVSHLRIQRERVQEVVVSELKSTRYLELIRRLRLAVHEPSVVESPVTLPELAKREFKKLRKTIRQLGPSPNHARLHEVRIKAKRARYATDLAVWSMGKPASRFMKRAQAVQDLLGDYQDALQAETYIRAFLKQSVSVRAGFVAGRLVERQRQRRLDVLAQLKPELKSLLKRGRQTWG
ncbi:MAG TPA: CYTH and CHAD domain-containing protein [Nitrospira sp.]|nr:CYTH and CHAD domain-containing protein [Nitrospira sp.]